MSPDAWPTPSEGASREPLPRLEDLPAAQQGYDQASVKAAFDSFYRHAAQLDAALRTLEAVDSFQRQATALRADLRTLRAAGWTQQPFPGPSAYGYETRAPREGVSPAVWRILGEVVFLIAVSVFLGIAKVPWWVIVSVMGGAFLIVAIIEWAASRDRWSARAPAPVAAHPVVESEPAPPAQAADEGESMGWAAYEQAEEPSDAMTMIGAPHDSPAAEEAPAEPAVPPPDPEASEVAEPQPVASDRPAPAVEPGADGDGPPVPAEPEPAIAPAPEPALEPAAAGEPAERRRWWRRSPQAVAETAPEPEAASGEAPRHVRVLGADEDAAHGTVDPWEQGFDPGPDGGEGTETADPAPEPDEQTGENGSPVAAEAESPGRRRFRRR